MSGGGATNNLGAASSTAQSTQRLNALLFNDFHFSGFVAMETPITIVPRFTLQRVDCLGGAYGPFEPNYPVDVPLWLAMHLRQTDTCTVDPPSYLTVPFLRGVLEREEASDDGFEALPFYFFEVAKQLCESPGADGSKGSSSGGGAARAVTGGGGGGGHAAGDILNVAEVARLVQELRSVRQRKLRQSMGVFEPEGSAMAIPGIRLTHIICSELHFLRSSFAVVLGQAAAMEGRRARPMDGLALASGGGFGVATSSAGTSTTTGASGGGRMPAVSVATAATTSAATTTGAPSSFATTPARPSSGSVATTATAGLTDSTAATTTPAGGSFMGSSQATTTAQEGDGRGSSLGGSTVAPTTTTTTSVLDATPAQPTTAPPPIKKRRTLRQT